jgi:hypothetical protein
MKRLILLTVLVTGLAAVSNSGARAPVVAHAARYSCGRIHVPGGVLAVTVVRGRVRCSTARSVFVAFFNGKGQLHGPRNGPAYKQSWRIGRWSCGHGAGGGGCISGGASFRTARDWILAQEV